MSIQRWHQCRQCGMVKDVPGHAHDDYGKYEDQGPYYVLYADHVAALDAEYARVTEMALDATRDSYELGIAKGAAEGVKTGRSGALADAVAAVEALHSIYVTWANPGDRYANMALVTSVDGVISAIKGVSHE